MGPFFGGSVQLITKLLSIDLIWTLIVVVEALGGLVHTAGYELTMVIEKVEIELASVASFTLIPTVVVVEDNIAATVIYVYV
jgi:hypothetical protein